MARNAGIPPRPRGGLVAIPEGGSSRLMNSETDIFIEKAGRSDLHEWVRMRCKLWPEESEQELWPNAEELLAGGRVAAAFLARAPGGVAVGFAEATLRHDNVNGCATSPVGFLEGLYVRGNWRKRGVARLLCQAVERWAIDLGCSELGSDTQLENIGSQKMHAALGFDEMERVVCYRKAISRPSDG
jgi:aminoglycoside 6'-N-acetyltransferase I